MASDIVLRQVPVVLDKRSLQRIVSGSLVEARPVVQAIFAVRFLCGAWLSGRPTLYTLERSVAGAAIWFLGTLCVYLFNGVTDVAADRANGSRRPIAGGRLTVAEAIGVVWGCATVSLVAAALLDWRILLLLAMFLGLGYAYSAPPLSLKDRTGSAAMVALAGGLLTYVAGAVAAAGTVDPQLVMFALGMAVWMGVIGCQAKDLPDVAGDRAAGRRTIAVRWGEWTVRLVLALSALLVGTAMVAVSAGFLPGMWPSAAAVAAGAVLLAASVLTRHSTGGRARRRRPYRIFMWTQYLSHASLLAVLT